MVNEIERGNDEEAFYLRANPFLRGRSAYWSELIWHINQKQCIYECVYEYCLIPFELYLYRVYRKGGAVDRPYIKFSTFKDMFEHYIEKHYFPTAKQHTRRQNIEYGILQQVTIYESAKYNHMTKRAGKNMGFSKNTKAGEALLKLSKEFGLSSDEIAWMLGEPWGYSNGCKVLRIIERALPPTNELPTWAQNALKKE